MGNAACRSLLDEAKNYQLLRFSSFEQPNIQEPRTRSREPLKLFCDTLYAVGRHIKDGFVSVERVNPEEAQPVWQRVAPMSRRRVGLGNAFLNDFLYAIGGLDGETYLNSAERGQFHLLTSCTPRSL
ncbi:kelch repeat protein [Cooperia oncophora]